MKALGFAFVTVMLALPALAQPTTSQPPAGAFAVYKPYNAFLQRYCQAKRLYLLSPGDLSDAVESFEGSLTPHQRKKITLRQAENKKASCAANVTGATCGNIAFLQAANELKLLPKFTRMICHIPSVCKSQSNCGPR